MEYRSKSHRRMKRIETRSTTEIGRGHGKVVNTPRTLSTQSRRCRGSIADGVGRIA